LALPAEWVPGPLKEFHWTALLQARAIENTAYVVAAGQNAPTGVGRSAIIDPMGIAVATIGEETGIAQAQLHQNVSIACVPQTRHWPCDGLAFHHINNCWSASGDECLVENTPVPQYRMGLETYICAT